MLINYFVLSFLEFYEKNGILETLVFALLLLVSIVGINIMTNVYGQDEKGDIETDNEIWSQLGSELVTNETVSLTDNQNDTSMLNFSEPGVGEFDNFTTPMLGYEPFDTGYKIEWWFNWYLGARFSNCY